MIATLTDVARSSGTETATDTVLSVRGLTKRFGRSASPAVAAVDLEVESGEIMAVVGESGCGKTTFLRMVAGLEMPDAGEIEIAGLPVAAGRSWVPPEKRGVGMVFQDFALFPHMTALQNIIYGLGAVPRGERRARADEVLELVGLSGYGERYPHQLSGGQQQRIALARALAPQPRLLLLDEPFSNLDTSLKRSLREEIGDILRATGTTALLVVHDVEDVLILADRAAVMRDGRILQQGDPTTLYRRPTDEYVARFFGETNLLAARPAGLGFETALGHVPCRDAATCRGSVRLCLRPEDLRIVADDEPGRPAVVRRIRMAGTRRRVMVSLENGSEPGETLMVDAALDQVIALGDRVIVQSRPDCVHFFAS